MLVLSRQINEAIIVGDDEITITVVDIRGDKVLLGITAPNDKPIHRQEVFNAIKRKGEPLLRPKRKEPTNGEEASGV